MRLYIFVLLFFSINNSIADEKQIDSDPIQKLQNKLDEFEEGFTQQAQAFDELNKLISQQQKAIGQIDKQQIQINEKFNYQALRKELLDRQENRIDTWLEVLALVLTVFALLVPLGAFLLNRKINKNIKEQVEETKNIKKEVSEHVAEIEQLKLDVRKHIEEIEVSKEKAHNDSHEISLYKQSLLTADQTTDNPSKTQKIINELDESDNKLDKLIGQAFKLQKEGHIETAIDKWRDILAIVITNDDKALQQNCYFSLGYLFDEDKKYYEAIASYKDAIRLNPDDDKAYFNLGISYAALEHYPEAIAAYYEAIRLNPDDAKTYTILGVSYGKQGEMDKAITAFEKAIELNPDGADAYNNLGIGFGKKGMIDNAIKAYEKAIELNPDITEAYANLFELYLVHDEKFEADLLAEYKLRFKDEQLAMMKITMLEMFYQLAKETKVFTEEFKQQFAEIYQGCSFEGWDWKDIELWVDNKENQSLFDALKFFKSFE